MNSTLMTLSRNGTIRTTRGATMSRKGTIMNIGDGTMSSREAIMNSRGGDEGLRILKARCSGLVGGTTQLH